MSLCLLCLMSEEIRETDSVTMSTRSDVRKKYMRQIVLLRHSLMSEKICETDSVTVSLCLMSYREKAFACAF